MARGMNLGRPAVGSRVGAWGPDLRPPERSGTEAWDRHPLAKSTRWEGASGRRWRATASPPKPRRVVSASSEYSLLDA